MDTLQLDRVFKPRRIAVVGASPNPNAVGGKVLSNLVGGGFRGVVYPVHPTQEAVLGVPCYPSVRALPRTPDLAVVAAPAAQVPDLVAECGEAGILGLVVLSAGFREVGRDGQALEERVLAQARRFEGMRIVGPNCLGVLVPSQQLNASFAAAMPRPGKVAFVSQSGALCTSVLDWALSEKIGFSHFVSIGNTLDVDFGDLIDYFGEDENTSSMILYVESIRQPRRFLTAARAFARTKPVIVYKAGRFPESAAVAASHTGALAGEDAVYDAAFSRAGLARVFDIGEIFDTAELLARHKIPRGPRLGIVTNAGGPGVMASDALIAHGGTLAPLTPESLAHLDEVLPPFWSHRNPVDVLGDARSRLYAKAVGVVLQDPTVDALLVIVTPQAMTNPTAIAKELATLASASPKPVLAAWLGGASMRGGVEVLNDAGIPSYTTPEQAVRAFTTLVSYARNLEILYETPKEISVEFPVDRGQARSRFAGDLRASGPGGVLAEDVSKGLLEAYGIPVTRPRRARDAEEAVARAEEIGYPVVLKILSPDITHKTDVGGVALDLRDAAMVREAFAHVLASVGRRAPAARREGVTVQRQVDVRQGVELILGIKKDPTFGTVILTGLGGTAAEVFGDRALGFPPLNERLARRMLESLRVWPLLQGYRGGPPADVDELVEVLVRLSYLAADFPEIEELDVNPLVVLARGAVALDARVVVGPTPSPGPARDYAHLALRPYPEEYVRRLTMRDGTEVTLRPIKPEDEPLWLQLLGSCSRESIYSRFRHFFFWQSHDVATRFCYIDYDRELAIVAERGEGEERRLLGVGRLSADPGRESAEYAVLVQDDWQDRGLGGDLTDFCTEIARDWGVRRLTALTTSDNPRMVAVFRRRGWDVRPDPDGSLVEVRRDLA